jgi:hypothetical protein
MNMTATREDTEMIAEIAKRFVDLCKGMGQNVERISIIMDLTAAHTNGCPLRLQELAEADDFNLIHDVMGINQHLDRNTGTLTDCFVPRFAA